MRNAYVIYPQFYDREGKDVKIGGIETYIYNLCEVLSSVDFVPTIYQFADFDFCKEYNGVRVVGVKAVSSNYKKNSKTIIKAIRKTLDAQNDIVIFASEEYIVPCKAKNIITIQHGVSWDIPNNRNVLFNYSKNSLKALIEYRRLNKCSHVVCVDYNFLNWYRAVFKKYNYEKFHVIPNFCDIQEISKPNNENVKIIFARRFVEQRGAILFANVAKKMVKNYTNVQICFAGEGPCEREMKEILSDCENITFTTFAANESIAVHLNYDIAVVPTIGSEGTSLSLLEAMSAKCAVISTNVGGLTNILIDGYNGRIVNATEDEVYRAIEDIIVDEDKRKYFQEKARETVINSFSKEKWAEKWTGVLRSL